ncbi:hypothetical protein OS493_014477 [Desmophyllum pertusum]|uniref:Alpha-(1,6)-fucosyltransferase N- and catalytic domain-containing protein n=1 Tax=Desmophyllum pertusum TaxID=174260 RepID=A0A9W9YPL5_9CNID|nr:hypothetical protein OS493_014477 [Desmophyllum pertusum]
MLDFNVPTSETTRNWSSNNTILVTAEDVKKAFVESDGVLAAMRRNRGKPTGSAVCVVDPAIVDCQNMGFAAFLLYTLDHVMFCRALGIDRPTVYWKACNSVCSGDSRVNSWHWYFEAVNHGLESKVENVLCLLRAKDDSFLESLNKTAKLDVRPIIDNSFKDRIDVVGYEDSKIITTQERMRINKLIQQYVKPNSRIRETLRMFYHRYLAGFTVLGVHVRGTDHWAETSEQKLPSLMSWVEKAQLILETLPRPRKIFIASDNNEVIKKFVTCFGKDTVVFTKAVRAKGYHSQNAPHAFKFKENAADPYERQIGTQVLLDILLLAKCDHFLHTESSVASLASYFNPHMTSYFLDEMNSVKKQEKPVLERSRTEETRKTKQEKLDEPAEFEDLVEFVECFQRNSAASVCPNTAKGIFVSLKETRRIFGRL